MIYTISLHYNVYLVKFVTCPYLNVKIVKAHFQFMKWNVLTVATKEVNWDLF